jgi:putative phosphoesterase
MVHASPPESIVDGIRLLDETGNIINEQKSEWTTRLNDFDYDVLIVGHTHQVFAEQLGATLVINPGSTEFNHTCGILSLPEMKFQLFPLSNKTPVRSWNWGLFFANRGKND